ncbi:MCP four helix bundle domain-containing protein, partial [Bradyrhizobium sp.]|uniref:MCP four helix bundle domain-containing protein n=1 Tax=Bradyrhizobium sp. TaxID=376 RepID=UPI0027346051
MSILARFKIITKILAVILMLAAIAGAVSWMGIQALGSLNARAEYMNAAAKRSLMAARSNQNVIALNRAEFRVALDPGPESREAVRKVIDEQMQMYQERIAEVGKTTDDKVRAMMPAIAQAMAEYKASLDNTLRLADATKDVKLAPETVQLRDNALKSRALSAQLQDRVRTAGDGLAERVDRLSREASEEYQTTSRLLMIVTVVGVLLGLAAGFLIAKFGIVNPIVSLKAVMEALAGNDLKAEVPGTDRRDEVGDMARTVEVFKKNGLEVEHLKMEQQASEKRAAEQRKADMIKLANDFEGAVGEIVETVSSSSTQ